MSREDFQRAIRAGKLSEAFLLALSQAPELRITTWIASPEANANQQIDCDRSLHTQINFVSGEIDNVIGERMLDESHPEIERVHFDEVKRAGNTVRENLETVQKMLHSLAAFSESPQTMSQAAVAPQNEDSYQLEPQPELATEVTDTFVPEDEVDSVVDEMMSLADIDPDGEDIDETTLSTLKDDDWGDWLDDDAQAVNGDRRKPQENSDDWQ